MGARVIAARSPAPREPAAAGAGSVAAHAAAPPAPRPQSRPPRAEAPREREPASPPPKSLRDTDADGALRVDEHGDLILGPEVIRFFDYFLSATGEETPEALRARILAAIRERLDGAAALQAAALLDRYLGYRQAAMRMPPGLDSDDPKARLESIQRLRREHFGEEAASKLFGDEEREDAVAAERSRVASDPTLTPEERDAKLAELESELPDSARAAREESRRPLRQQAEEEALRAAGATEQELYQHRVETVGEEAAQRLTDLDRQRAEWKQRVEAFRLERERIAATTPDDAARRAAQKRALEASFTPEEQLRVKAILKIRDY
ncbi:MAG: lipase chaperone [Polyangiaceae bacterium]|nr:lipase chaperone [Polyangiaceae bacterium]